MLIYLYVYIILCKKFYNPNKVSIFAKGIVYYNKAIK